MTDLRKFRLVLSFFIFALVVSGVTAFPLLRELDFLSRSIKPEPQSRAGMWILTVRDGLADTYGKYPWMAYGTDWLAFAHIVIAIFFIGPWIDPVRNIWTLKAGLVACVLVIPLALVCGSLRKIPFGWQLIDCSFGVAGAIPLFYCLKLARKLETAPIK